jgi:glycosyltransferase involved in cell wall biosynthesis
MTKNILKIAVVGSRNIPADYGGVETATEGLYTKLAEKGHKIIFYGRNKSNTYEKTDFKGIKVINLPTINMVGVGTFFHCFISSVFAVFSDADIVHYHAQGPALFSFIPKIFAPKKKIVFTCQGIDWQRDKWQGIAKKVIKMGEVNSAKLADARIMVSGGLLERYKEVYGVQSVRIPNGVNIPEKVEIQNIKQKFNLEKGKYIIFVGRLVPEKAPDILIKAFREVNTDIKLVLAGDAPETQDYEKQLKELAKGDERIVFTSFIRGRDLAELYSNALAYVSPSKLEGNPLTGLEAMSYELPMVLSDIQPHDEMLSYDRGAGISFETNNVDACKNALNHLFSLNEEELRIMGQKAKEIVKNSYSWDKISEDTEKVYFEITRK